MIVVTYPAVKYNPKIHETYKHYCYYQMIKYSNWTINDLTELRNKDTDIIRFEEFIKNTTPEIRETIR